MKQYIELGNRIINEGQWITIGDTRRLTVFGAQLDFDLTQGFPIVTTKKVWWRGIVEELIWFLNGSTNVKDLQDVGVHIWDANARPDGTIGDSYGAQWRNWNGEGYDQIANCIKMLRSRPKSTRNVVMAWNPEKIGNMALPPCHFSFQCLSDGRGLTLLASMRSTDFCLGLSYNVASYALLAHMLAMVSGLKPERLIMQLSHVHIYEQHSSGWATQSQRELLPLPSLSIQGVLPNDLKGLKSSQFSLINYQHHPSVDYEMVVT